MKRIINGINWRLRFTRDQIIKTLWQLRNYHDLIIKQNQSKYPSITLVVVGRNDNYGGDFQGRLRTMLEWNLQYPFAEVIYVEWNPLKDRSSDAQWLVEKYLNLKVYTVSAERHLRLCTSPNMPMLEYFAKNVGIRRASSDYVCLANADVLIGPDAFKRFTTLRKDRVYGTHTVNIKWHGGKILEPHLKEFALGGFTAKKNLFSVVGDFALAHRDLWHSARGYDESMTDRRICCDDHGVAQLIHLGAKPRIIGTHYHLDHPESSRNALFNHQGSYFDPWDGIPYFNGDEWGQGDAETIKLADRVFYLS